MSHGVVRSELHWPIRAVRSQSQLVDCWRPAGAELRQVVNVVAERDEEVKEHLRAALLHLHLHRAAPLEGLAAADDEREIVGAEPRVAGRRVRVRESCAAQDRRYVDAGLQALLAKSEALQVWQRVALRGTVDGCIPKDVVAHAVVVNCRELVEADEFLFGGVGAR